MIPLILVLIVGFAWPGATPMQSQTGRIEGVVKDSLTNAALYGVLVGVVSGTDDAVGPQPQLFKTTTDETGRFHIEVPPGDYTLRAQRDGYFGVPRNGVPMDAASHRFTIARGQAITGVAITLQPGGAITGQLLDQAGFARSGMSVTAMRVSYDRGRRILIPAKTAQTNDRGEFRLYWVAPGEYVISGTPRSGFVLNTTSPRRALPARTFFPGTADVTKATPTVVQSGSETGGINFIVQAVQTVNVSGRIVNLFAPPRPDPAPSQSAFVAPPNIGLATRGAAVDETLSSFGNNATAAERREGIFRFIGVLPGAYDLFVIAGDGGPALSTVAVARVPVEVGNQDVSGITVNVRPPVDLKGRIILPGAEPRIEFPKLQLWPVGNVPGMYRSATPPKVTLGPNGEFTIRKLLPGDYSFDFNLPDGTFLADMRQGERSINGERGITITGDAPDTVQIVLGRNGGSIQGRIQTVSDKAALDTTVALVPEPALRANSLLYYTAHAADNGSFEMKNIAPGNYKLFAWDGVLSTAWMNAEFLKQYEDRSTPIRVEQKEISGVIVNVF